MQCVNYIFCHSTLLSVSCIKSKQVNILLVTHDAFILIGIFYSVSTCLSMLAKKKKFDSIPGNWFQFQVIKMNLEYAYFWLFPELF